MAEPNSWKSWHLPPLDQDGKAISNAEKQAQERYGKGRKKTPPEQTQGAQAETDNHTESELTNQESIDDEDEEQAESVEVVEPEQFSFPSAEEIADLRKSVELDAYREGFEKGEQHGKDSGLKQAYEESKADIEQHIQQLEQISHALQQPIDQQDQAIEEILLNSVIKIAKAVVHNEIKNNPEQISAIVHQAVSALPYGESKTKIFLHPSDIKFIKQHASEHPHWQLVEDEELTPGGCRVVTADSAVNATVEARLQSAIDQFLGKQLAGIEEASATEKKPVDSANPLPREG